MTSKQSGISSPVADRPYEWIDTPRGLERLAGELSKQERIGLDTESDSFHHYRERVCLIQISTRDHDTIIDPLALRDLSLLRPLFQDPNREWVMNGADYDIVCLKRDFDIHFARIFDTVVAAQLLGYRATGLAAMLKLHFQVNVSKTFQRDEWFRRPLTPGQIDYALNDTRYLLPLRKILMDKLVEMKRLSWAEEEFAQVSRRVWTREPFSPEDFWRIRGSRDLPAREQIILRELAIMRDNRARAANRPPFKIISDAALLAIARAKPRNESAVARVKGISPLMMRRLGADILEAVRAGSHAGEDSLPPVQRGERRRHDPGVGARLEALKEWRRKKAAALQLDPGVLCPLSYLQSVARANPRSVAEIEAMEDVSRWRIREFGQEWIQALA